MKTFGTLFSGGGGVDVGLMAAGLTPLWAVEYDADIAAVYRQNIGEHMHVADVRQVDYSTLAPVDWLHASPVCTRASVANAGAVESDEDVQTAQAVVRAIDTLRPDVFTLENVWGYRDFAAFRLILNALGAGGYFYDFEHVNCADFGVPQTRKRLLLRASRGLLPALPQPVPWVGWYEAIVDLVPTLPESKLAPWQLARLPVELRETVLLEMQDGQRSEATLRAAHEPTFTISASMASRPSHTAAVLVSNAKTEYGDGMALVSEPAWSVTSNTQGRSRALLVPGLLNDESSSMTTRNGDAPAITVTTSHNQRDLRAVLINESSSMEVRSAYELAATQVSSERTAAQRAVLGGSRVVAMTPRCLARFQSLPDWYVLPDRRTLAAKVIGNMVPPLLMQRIAEQMQEYGA
jgi:DNA (cytosine-5)-methyltransferase 1